MKRSIVVVPALLLALLCVLPSSAHGARDLEFVDLSVGYDTEDNVLTGPVFEGASAPPLVFEALTDELDRSELFVRKVPGGFVRPLRYGIAPSLDLAGLMTTALRSESATLGLRSSPAEEAVKVSGKISEAFVENRPVVAGAILFYAYMILDLELTFPDGRKETMRAVYHDMVSRYNGGFGARDEAGEAIARFLVQSAQEVAARIAREHLKAPVHPGVPALIPGLQRTGAEGQYVALRRLGLSGHPEALEPLLTLLSREKEEDNRSQVINALANLRSPEALERLASRYKADKDEDCRFYSIKAFVYRLNEGDGDQSLAWIKDLGTKDKNMATKRLARYWLDR